MEDKKLSNQGKKSEKNEEEEKCKDLQSFLIAQTNAHGKFQIEDQSTENVEIGGYASLNTPPSCSYTIDDIFMENEAIDPYSPWQDDFDFDQSNLQFNYIHPNSNSTELKQNTTDEIIFSKSAPGWIIETTSDINFGLDSRISNYSSEITGGQYGALSLSQIDLFHSKEKSTLPKETSFDVIIGRESESKCENFDSKHKHLKPNSDINIGIVVEEYNISTNKNDSNFERKCHCPICFKQCISENAAQKCNHSNEKNFQHGTQELNVSQVGQFSKIKPTHSKEKTFQFSVCEQNFIDKLRLDRHMVNHIEEKSLQCQCHVCERRFVQKGDLKRHMLSHNGEKPFQCDVCRKKFSRKGDLNAHMRSHTGEKPFQCDVCRKKFSRKGNLNAHMRIHVAEKPF
ncbi:hypothetical protein TNIN_174681 [Trichonephila inaurata madagascariensis]|uniref:C2H2-type domain-containing protein n=1 Tax=Trichonephila inaurata madagascariensis TaxID=2747483 RepID=A0A8X7CFH1_9ARAC|nr:hypothetical protein TNIN_174681 [Trichonephila inaurata madagascariensis]